MTILGGKDLRIAVCDDQRLYIDDVIVNCKNAFADEYLIFDCFSSGEELLASDLKSDFLFLDIEMSGIDGIGVKDILEQRQCETKVIFMTSHEERMIEAFGSNVIGFLHKPLRQNAFEVIVKKMKRFLSRETVEWEDTGKQYVVYADDIRYIEAQDKYTYVATKKENYLVRRTIKQWEELLPKPDFCRVNRSCMIHFKFFDKTRDKILLEEGKTVRISRIHKDAIMAQYMAYVRKKVEEM